MSIFRPNSARQNRIVPRLEALEDRRLCTAFFSHLPRTAHRTSPAGVLAATLFTIPHLPPTPARTGGAAALEGSVLVVVTNHPGANQAVIQDDGAGNVTVEWNGHTPPTFHGVSRIVLDGKGRTNAFQYVLTGNVTAPDEVDVLLHGSNSTFVSNLGGHQANGLTFKTETAPAPANLAKGP
jgi:hypothetical protein